MVADPSISSRRSMPMDTITTEDGTVIFFKDWGPRDAQPIVFTRLTRRTIVLLQFRWQRVLGL